MDLKIEGVGSSGGREWLLVWLSGTGQSCLPAYLSLESSRPGERY